MTPSTRELAVATADGVELRAYVTGAGPPLLLCHGGPGLWDNLQELAGLLAPSFTVWRYDQRGCGRSTGTEGPFTVEQSVQDLEAIRQASGQQRVFVGGHSWGATLAQLYASSYPERVLSLLYIAGTGIEWPKWRPMHRAEVERRRALPAYAEIARSAEHPNIVRWAVDFADPEVGRRCAEEMAATKFAVNTSCSAALNAELTALPAEEWLARCGRIQSPVLVIQGSEDPRPVESVDSMVGALMSVSRVVLLGAGHYPWVERPGGFVAEVQRFVSRTQGGSLAEDVLQGDSSSKGPP